MYMDAQTKNRRRAPRAKLSLPVRIRCFGANWPEEIGKTSNVSREGLYFETSARHYLEQYFHNWKVGVMRNFQPGDLANLEETGQILRIDNLPDGKLGIAIHILLRVKPEFTGAPDRPRAKK
jgi:PilZ domain-containing protein